MWSEVMYVMHVCISCMYVRNVSNVMYVCMYVCVSACMYVREARDVCHVCVHACMHAYMYAWKVCM